jgi:hypothetical protein
MVSLRVIPPRETRTTVFIFHPIGGDVFHQLAVETDPITFRVPEYSFVDRVGSSVLSSKAVSLDTGHMRANCQQFMKSKLGKSHARLKPQVFLQDKIASHDDSKSEDSNLGRYSEEWTADRQG